jgi:hypothetical protein
VSLPMSWRITFSIAMQADDGTAVAGECLLR